jgi:outer membrane protein insertion porin family
MTENRNARATEIRIAPSTLRWRRTLPLAAAALAWGLLVPDAALAQAPIQAPGSPAATGSVTPGATGSILPAPPVDQGPKIRVRDIEIRGNRTVSDETILLTLPIHRGEEVTRQQVLESLQRIYGLGYFLDVKASTEPVPGGERLVFHVVENPVFKAVAIVGETVFPEAELAAPFAEMKGKVINFRDVQQIIKDIEKKYADRGYVLARVIDLNAAPDGTLTIKLAEGTISAIRIEGNEETQDYVIRRELTQKPGELFNWKVMEEDLRRVFNLNFFEDIGIKYEPGTTPDQVTVVVNVKEKQTGSFNLSAGWSNRDGLLGIVGLRKENFLGRAQSISTDLTLSQRNWAAEISYFNPWIDNQKTSFGTNLYARRFWNFFGQVTDPQTGTLLNGFLEERRGGVVSFGRPLFGDPVTAQWRGALRLRAESIGLLTTDQARSLEGPAIFASGGSSDFATTAGFTTTFDSRDFVINPTRGWFNTYAVEQYIPGLSTLNLSRLQLDVNHYFPLWANHTLAAGWKLGTLFSATGGFVPPYERFFSTGSNLIRGWPENPVGAGALGQFPYGSFSGDSFTLASVEYRFPIVNILSGVVFGDTGIFWDQSRSNFGLDRTRSGYGAGIRINTPLGPLRLDYGLREWSLNTGVIHFSIGQKF